MMIARGEQVLMADADGATRWEDLELLQGRMQDLLKKQGQSHAALMLVTCWPWPPNQHAGSVTEAGMQTCCRKRVGGCQSPLHLIPHKQGKRTA